MNKYIKLFETTADYQEYINGSGVALPNVSVAKDAPITVYYNPSAEQPSNVIIYTATEKLDAQSSPSGSGSGSGSGSNAFYREGFRDENDQTLTIISHTFKNGVGRIKFNGDIAKTFGRTFMNCSSLITINIPNSITELGNDTFNGCTNLTSVNIPMGIEYIEGWSFKRCESLTNISIPNSVTHIDESSFKGSGLTSITIPDSVIGIAMYAFGDCSDLTNVTLGSGVAAIGYYAFSGCSGLTSITCNAMTAPSIDDGAFDGVNTEGTLYVPIGSTGYDVWMNYLGSGWTKVEQ